MALALLLDHHEPRLYEYHIHDVKSKSTYFANDVYLLDLVLPAVIKLSWLF
jgi:hypothetical protein